MARTKLTAVLSKDSFNQLANKVELFGQQYIKGLQLGIEEATNQCYQLISQKMETYGLSDHIGNIKVEFDLKNNIGKISTEDIVIIFHEFGTGIKGTQNKWADLFGYTVNQSGKGEDGWYFKNEKNNYEGITHGLTSKHIFYESLREIQQQLPRTVSISIAKTVGAMY